MQLKVYTCEHGGHYIGGISIVVAEDEEQAKKMLESALAEEGLVDIDIELNLLDTSTPHAKILFDGDY